MPTRLDYSLHYSRYHQYSQAEYDDLAAHYQRQFDLLKLQIRYEDTVLDVGCGAGFLLYACKKLGVGSVTGVDISEEQVIQARKFDLDAIQVEDTVAYLQQHKEDYDLVFLVDVLEHLSHEEQLPLLAAIYCSLKPGGKLVLQVPNANSIVASAYLYDDFTHRHCYTPGSISFLLENAGYSGVYNPVPPEPRPALRKLHHFFYKKAYRDLCFSYLIRRFWRKVLSSELSHGDFRRTSLDLDLLLSCSKPRS